MKRNLTTLITREMQIKAAIMGYHLIPVRMAITKNKTKTTTTKKRNITKVCENMKDWEPLCTLGRSLK